MKCSVIIFFLTLFLLELLGIAMVSLVIEEIKTHLSALQIYELFQAEKYSFFLDSSLESNALSQFSFIGCDPFKILQSEDAQTLLFQNGRNQIIKKNPFIVLKDLLKEYSLVNHTKYPFVGGAVGFFSYDLNTYFDYSPKKKKKELKIPEMVIGFYDHVLIYDHVTKKTVLASMQHKEGDNKNRQLIKDKIIHKITHIIKPNVKMHATRVKKKKSIISNITYEKYSQMIKKAKKYISDGHIYQVNLSHQFKCLITKDPFSIYQNLRTYNAAPFSAFFNYGSFQILSSSPERFLKIRNKIVETNPIKGTISRGNSLKEDRANKLILRKSIKNKAENYMIVDLLRNDLGKVCEFASVSVDTLCKLETYATVHHLVSTISGKMKNEFDAIDCLMACFPGGSITGAPKKRAMEIIDELEVSKRYIYTGSLGYIGFDGGMDLNIAIRTILISGNVAYYHVGGGIVWDSTIDKEYQETLDKGKALKLTLEL